MKFDGRVLSDIAKAWVESYVPCDVADPILKKKKGLRPANLHQDRSVIESFAWQCEKQGVSFPDKILIQKTQYINGWYWRGKNSYMVTEGAKWMEMADEPALLDTVIAHEVGHGAQRFSLMKEVLFRGGVFVFVSLGLKKIGDKLKQGSKEDFNETSEKVHSEPKNLRHIIGEVLSNRFFRFVVSYFASAYAGSKYSQFMEYGADRRAAENTSPQTVIDGLSQIEEGNKYLTNSYKKELGDDYSKPSNVKEWTKLIGYKVINPFPRHPPIEKRLSRIEAMKNSQTQSNDLSR